MSQDVPEVAHVRARGREVTSLYRRGLTWVSFRPLPDSSCALDLAIRQFPDLGIVTGRARGIRHEHVPENGQDGNDDVSLHLNCSGLSVVAGCGREFDLRDGDAMLLTYGIARTITRPGIVDHSVVRFPRRVLALRVRDVDAVLLRPIRQGTGPLRLLTHYVAALVADPALSAPDTRHLVVCHLADLLALALGAPADTVGRGLRAARLQAVKQDIGLHLADHGLSTAAVARRQGISESYIRKLFEAEGVSFSEFVMARRLAQARGMLSCPALRDQSIAAIAFEVGFGDLSYFNRRFRRAFGLTPSEVRQVPGNSGT